MKITLIQLIGSQRLPNIYPVLAFKPDTIVNVYSEQTKEDQTVLEETIYNITNKKVNIKSIYLTAAPSTEETKQALQTYIENETSEQDLIITNYTGATKLMSIGAYLFAKETETASVYLDTQIHKFRDGNTSNYSVVDRFLRGTESTKELLGSIPLDVILKAHSYAIKQPKKPTNKESNKELLVLAHAIDELKQSEPTKVLKLYESKDEKAKLKNINSLLVQPFDFGDTINKLCVEAKLMKWNDADLKNNILIFAEPHLSRSKRESHIKSVNSFLSGCWWELLLLSELQQQINLDEILWSVDIQQGQGDPEEEDIFARINTEFFFFSCKISNALGKISTELDKLANRSRSMGGIFAKPILAIYNFTNPRDEKKFREKAEKLKITIITRENLDNLANVDIFTSHGKKPTQQVK